MSDEDLFSNLQSHSELLTNLTDDYYNRLVFDSECKESSDGCESDTSDNYSDTGENVDDGDVSDSVAESFMSNAKADLLQVHGSDALSENIAGNSNDYSPTTAPIDILRKAEINSGIGMSSDSGEIPRRNFMANPIASTESAKSSPAIYTNMNSEATKNNQLPQNATKNLPPNGTSTEIVIPHRGSLRRILNATSEPKEDTNIKPSTLSMPQPVYVISVRASDADIISQTQHLSLSITPSHSTQIVQLNRQLQSARYNVIFDRQQYEFCTRLFALLDTECQSLIGPACIREFISLHCPVVKRRDEAIISRRMRERTEAALKGEYDGNEEKDSPTFEEIWRAVLHSDHRIGQHQKSMTASSNALIGLEGWMLFCRLLSLAEYQESRRRFASRHLQQMMRHKHGAGSRGNEVVIMVDNPPPGPPMLISFERLIQVEQERNATVGEISDGCVVVQGSRFYPLPLPELDLDHYLVSTFCSKASVSTQMWRRSRGKVVVEPFSSSKGDFILRYHSGSAVDSSQPAVVVRRSRADFEWLRDMLKSHKKPGHGHLCGRILPPFPSKQGQFYSPSASTISMRTTAGHKDVSGRALGVAKSSVGIVTSIAKSLWVNYMPLVSSDTTGLSSTTIEKSVTAQSSYESKLNLLTPIKSEDVPAEVARGIERYLNYLLGNTALSTSFPLNAIIKANQSGLESAKQMLQEYSKQKKRRENQSIPSSNGKPLSAAAIVSALVARKSASFLFADDDSSWLRTAAQIAMTLQFHGILETTGHESASARIQHASLPRFGNHSADDSWDEDETDNANPKESEKRVGLVNEACFEAGVISVDSDLTGEADTGGYDLLPLPGPSETHHVLNAGCNDLQILAQSLCDKPHLPSSRFVYDKTAAEETPPTSTRGIEDITQASLGPLKTDDDVDKLHDIVRSVDNTLRKLHRASAVIRSAQEERNNTILELLRGVDFWGNIHGEVINQRTLVKGVEELEKFNSSIEKGNKKLSDDLAWQSSLATSALNAAIEVRGAVKSSRTASRAKTAALSAAKKAQEICITLDRSTPSEEIQLAQANASKTQSQAIHAAVVEYEANIAKKRAAVSLAHDIQCWNLHRKKCIFDSCYEMALLQNNICHKTANMWENLRDGLIESSTISFEDINQNFHSINMVGIPEFTATLFDASIIPIEETDEPNVFPCIEDHYALRRKNSEDHTIDEKINTAPIISEVDEVIHLGPTIAQSFMEEKSPALTSVTAPNSVTSAMEHVADNSCKSEKPSNLEGVLGESFTDICPPETSLLDNYFSVHSGAATESSPSEKIISGDNDAVESCYSQEVSLRNQDTVDAGMIHNHHRDAGDQRFGCCSDLTNNDESHQSDDDDNMQSLIDSLISWGGTDGQDNESTSVHLDPAQL